jgi:hypothetical protein
MYSNPLPYGELDGTYITTDKRFKFLEITKDAEEKVYKSMLSNETTNDHLS